MQGPGKIQTNWFPLQELASRHMGTMTYGLIPAAGAEILT